MSQIKGRLIVIWRTRFSYPFVSEVLCSFSAGKREFDEVSPTAAPTEPTVEDFPATFCLFPRWNMISHKSKEE